MAHKDFFIYMDRNELLTPSNTEYRVQNLLKRPSEFKKAIQKCQEELDSDGAQFVFNNFDKLFSVIECINQVNYTDLHYIYENILVKSLNIIGSFFLSYGDIKDIEGDLRHKYTNIIKMTVYLFIEFVHSFNLKIENDYKLILLETKGRNKKQDMILKHTSDYDWNWEDKLCDGLKALNSIISTNITLLYDPPYIDHTFISYIASCCYTQLEHSSIAFVRNKRLCDSIIQILMTLIVDYDHAHNFKIKVVQMLKLYEHLPVPFAKTVLLVIESGNNWSSLIELIIKEIAESNNLYCLKETGNQDITGGKSYCVFLVEIAKHYPHFLLPNIKHLLPCLEFDPYTIRTCVLSVIKELIIHVLNNDELDELKEKTRDNYFSMLRDHLLDTNAFVRSKVLQLFTEIINAGSLPKQMYNTIMICAEEKLHDKSSYVTKSAILLIKTLMKSNPYNYDFTKSTLQECVETEKCTINNAELVLKNKLNPKINKEEMWLTIETPLKSFLEDSFKNNSLESIGEFEVFEDIQLSVVFEKIKRLTTLNKFKAALKLILHGKKTFTDEPLFKIRDEKNNLSEQLFLLLKSIWWSKDTKPLTSLSTQALSVSIFEQMITEDIHLQIFKAESKIAYLQECIDYLDTMKKAIYTIDHLLFGSTSESLEAIDFFTVAYQFGIPYIEVGIESMILLIFSTDANIKAAVINSYKIIYLKINENGNLNTEARTIMTRLIHLLKTLNVSNKKAFTALLHEWIHNNTLSDDYIKVLWAWFTKFVTVSHEDQVLSALLLSFLSSAKPSIVNGNLDSLIEHGLCNDYELFIYSCLMLEHISMENFNRFTEIHDVVNRLISITHKCFFECNVVMFSDVSSNVINMIYQLTVKPDIICKKLIDMLFNSMQKHQNKNDSCENFDSNLFAKFIFIIGDIAFKQCNYLENRVTNTLIKTVRAKYNHNSSTNDKSNNIEGAHDVEAAEIEAIHDEIRQVCDKQLVTGSGMLSCFSKYVLKACTSANHELRSKAIITLVKFMLVSTPFCRKHMQTYLNIFESTDKVEITIDLISSFGWLIFKHPNLLEPFTDRLYARLMDNHEQIRYSALSTIIDLIRKEMIKVKGQSACIARLIVDENEKIQYDTKVFFMAIAEKGNTLYNVISDIISVLSNPDSAVLEEDFQLIMKFLLPLINKERQIETLVDKLCKRLKDCNDDTQAYYISDCLTLIKYNDRSLTKLSDNITLYSDRLKNPKVYNSFNIIISTNSRLVKPETKQILINLNEQIKKIVKDEGFGIARSFKTPGKRLHTGKKKPSKTTVIDSSVCEIEPLQLETKRSSRLQTKVKRRLMMNESEENDELAPLTNIQNAIHIKVDESSDSNNDEVDLFKRTTRQKNL